MTVIVQAGHLNIQQNCNQALRGETGAPGEVEINTAVAKVLVQTLMDHGVTAQLVDANFNCSPQVTQYYDAVVALHCQSDPPAESGWDIGVGDPQKDGAAAQSAKLAQDIADWYEAATGLTRQTWCQNNPNVQDYYVFNALSGPTPFALIEMCNATLDNQWAWEHIQRMADGIANGILSFVGKPTFAIPSNTPPPTEAPVDTTTTGLSLEQKKMALLATISQLKTQIEEL